MGYAASKDSYDYGLNRNGVYHQPGQVDSIRNGNSGINFRRDYYSGYKTDNKPWYREDWENQVQCKVDLLMDSKVHRRDAITLPDDETISMNFSNRNNNPVDLVKLSLLDPPLPGYRPRIKKAKDHNKQTVKHKRKQNVHGTRPVAVTNWLKDLHLDISEEGNDGEAMESNDDNESGITMATTESNEGASKIISNQNYYMGNSCGLLGPKVLPDSPPMPRKKQELDFVNHHYYNKLYQNTVHQNHQENNGAMLNRYKYPGLRSSSQMSNLSHYATYHPGFHGSPRRFRNFNRPYRGSDGDEPVWNYTENPIYISSRSQSQTGSYIDTFAQFKHRPFYASDATNTPRRRLTERLSSSDLWEQNPNTTLRNMGFDNFILSSPVNSRRLSRTFRKKGRLISQSSGRVGRSWMDDDVITMTSPPPSITHRNRLWRRKDPMVSTLQHCGEYTTPDISCSRHTMQDSVIHDPHQSQSDFNIQNKSVYDPYFHLLAEAREQRKYFDEGREDSGIANDESSDDSVGDQSTTSHVPLSSRESQGTTVTSSSTRSREKYSFSSGMSSNKGSNMNLIDKSLEQKMNKMVRETILSGYNKNKRADTLPRLRGNFSRHGSLEAKNDISESSAKTSTEVNKAKYGIVLHEKIASTLASILLEKALNGKPSDIKDNEES